MWSMPQALQPILGDQPRDQAVHRAEACGILDPQAGEIVDVEKAAVVDAGDRYAPVGEAIVLALQQPVQRLPRRLRSRRR